MNPILLISVVGLLAAAEVRAAERAREKSAIDESRIVDLTHAFDEETIYWPTAQPFRLEKEAWGMSAGGYWYAAARYSASEHGGTHLDAPIHFAWGQATVDEIPITRLVGPAVVIDLSAACATDRDYRLAVADITAWEQKHGAVPAGSIVLARTGWSRFWPDKKQYLGSDAPGDTANLHFPGVSREAAEYLVKRKIDGVGLDTASLDHGPSKDFIAHRVLCAAGIFGLENLAQLEKVPATGATVLALPMKIKGGSGAPVRVVAIVP